MFSFCLVLLLQWYCRRQCLVSVRLSAFYHISLVFCSFFTWKTLFSVWRAFTAKRCFFVGSHLQQNGFIKARSSLFNELLNEWLHSAMSAIKHEMRSIDFGCGKIVFYEVGYGRWVWELANYTELNIIIVFFLLLNKCSIFELYKRIFFRLFMCSKIIMSNVK